MKKKNPLVKPFLKWAGGKRQLIHELNKHIPPRFTKYYEPFIGAGALFFELQPKVAYINDFNEQLVMTYQAIKDNVDELIHHLEIHTQNNSNEHYYTTRELDRDSAKYNSTPAVEKAARLIYMNKTCYNGLYRVNAQGLFNVPYGKYKNPLICDAPTLRAIHSYLNNNEVHISSGDFAEVVKSADKHSFVYFDPPYHSDDNTNFTGYQANGFNESEQIRLKETFDELTLRGVKCLLSNADTLFIRDLYKEYTVLTVTAKRAINSDSEGRGDVTEVLVRNW
jgi:DNA adenine methylase